MTDTQDVAALVAEMSDADKLRALADWFDSRDDVQGNFLGGQRECQRDLRRMADALERQQAVVEVMRRIVLMTTGHPDLAGAIVEGEQALTALDAPPEGEKP